MPWTRKQVRYLESSGSPLSAEQKAKMNAELHADPSLGHHTKGSNSMKDARMHGFGRTEIEHHMDGSHTVRHFPMPKRSKGGAFVGEDKAVSYSATGTPELISKVSDHLGPEVKEDEEA